VKGLGEAEQAAADARAEGAGAIEHAAALGAEKAVLERRLALAQQATAGGAGSPTARQARAPPPLQQAALRGVCRADGWPPRSRRTTRRRRGSRRLHTRRSTSSR
jgi:hypothetical protein